MTTDNRRPRNRTGRKKLHNVTADPKNIGNILWQLHVKASLFPIELRDEVMKRCGWKAKSTFYDKVNGFTELNIVEREIIEALAIEKKLAIEIPTV